MRINLNSLFDQLIGAIPFIDDTRNVNKAILDEFLHNLDELREDPEKHNQFFNLYSFRV